MYYVNRVMSKLFIVRMEMYTKGSFFPTIWFSLQKIEILFSVTVADKVVNMEYYN